MTAQTQAPGTAEPSSAAHAGPDWTALYPWVIGLLLALVAGLVIGVISLSSKLDALSAQVAAIPSGSTTVDTTDVSTRVDDACRVLGALAFKAGVDLPTAFGDEGATGTCEAAAEGAYHRLKTR